MERVQENEEKLFPISSILEIFLWNISEQNWINAKLYFPRFSMLSTYPIAYNIEKAMPQNVVSPFESFVGLGIFSSFHMGLI